MSFSLWLSQGICPVVTLLSHTLTPLFTEEDRAPRISFYILTYVSSYIPNLAIKRLNNGAIFLCVRPSRLNFEVLLSP